MQVDRSVARKLERLLGARAARALVAEIASDLSLDELASPSARLAIGQALVQRGGVFAAAGHAIRAQAMLHGAV